MIICLSSGARPRYLEDVLRSVALAPGATIQFRYDNEWVGSDVVERIRTGSIVGESVLIAYADQATVGPDESGVQIVPLRMGKVVSAALPGETVMLLFEVASVAYAEDLPFFNREVVGQTSGLPRWTAGKPRGLYCATVSEGLSGVQTTGELALWEKVVRQLAGRPDFKAQETFITVLGFLSRNERREAGALVRHTRWPNQCGPDEERDLLVYHFHPTTAPQGWVLRVEGGKGVSIVSAGETPLDSRYDLKTFRIRTSDPAIGMEHSWIRTVVEVGDSRLLDIEAAIRIKSNFAKRVLIAAIIGIGLTGSQMIALLSRSDLTDSEKVASSIGMFCFAVLVGIAATWGIKRGI